MEQHPVPQNITTFQFRLIGDMTIKQFGYLAGGAILAYISYKLPLPFIFTWPLAGIFALGGFGFAFIPIEERPMDTWVFSFLHNVYNPTVFHWERTEPTTVTSPSKTPPKIAAPTFPFPFLSPQKPTPSVVGARQEPVTGKHPAPQTLQKPSLPSQPHLPAATPKAANNFSFDMFFSWIDNLFVTTPKQPLARAYTTPQTPQPPTHQQTSSSPASILTMRTPVVTGKHIDTVDKPQAPPPKPQPRPIGVAEKNEELNKLQAQLETLKTQIADKSTAETRLLELQSKMTEILSERQNMERELLSLKTKLQTTPQTPTSPIATAPSVKPQEPTIKTMGTDTATRLGLPRLTTFPNVVTGIIKDYDNNLLPGVLVTVKDKEGVPLRALKTNKLGQFAASTQLGNGTYVVEVEDPRNRFLFDRVQITLTGEILPALLIIAKSKRALEREQLQRQIFGTPSANT